MQVPIDNLIYERNLWEKGFRYVAGIDEAGRGPLAGPVVSASVVFEPYVTIAGVTDSKALSASRREKLYEQIIKQCVSYHIAEVDNETIDSINIYQATQVSMHRALGGLNVKPEYVLIDAMKLKLDIPNEPIVKGDLKSFTIAAASILAKVHRDRLMANLHLEYPVYNWIKNKGYPTLAHREAVKKFGFTPYHRKTFTVK